MSTADTIEDQQPPKRSGLGLIELGKKGPYVREAEALVEPTDGDTPLSFGKYQTGRAMARASPGYQTAVACV